MISQDRSAILTGIPFTIALTLAAVVVGSLLGFPLCAMRLSRFGVVRWLASALFLTFRSIPPIVWLFFIFFGIGLGDLQLDPFSSATIGLGLAGLMFAEVCIPSTILVSVLERRLGRHAA